MATNERMPASLLIERVLSIITVMGVTSLCIGVILYIIGNASGFFIVAQVGAILLLAGILLVAMRVVFWLLEIIAERGLESSIERSTFSQSSKLLKIKTQILLDAT
jgi:type III secretory pathway component EscR